MSKSNNATAHGRAFVCVGETAPVSEIVRRCAARQFGVRPGMWPLILTLLWAGMVTAQESQSPGHVECELRVLWGGPLARSFPGSIQIDNGTLRFVRNLSLESDSIGSIRPQGSSTLEVRPLKPSNFGGADIAIQAPLDARLTLRFEDPLTQRPVEHAVALEDLITRNWTQKLDERGAKIAIERQVHDRIRVFTDAASSVFDGGERWDAEIQGVRTGLAAGPYLLKVQITGNHIRSIPILQQPISIDADGSFTSPVQVNITTPAPEGTYQLEVAVYQRRLFNSILTPTADLIRRVEFVSFDPYTPPPLISEFVPLARLDAWDASRPGMLAWLAPLSNSLNALPNPTPFSVPERLGQLNPLARSLTQPISQGQLGLRVTSIAAEGQSRDSSCLTLAPGAWLAIPLQNLRPTIPHRVSLRTPCDQPFHLAVSVKQTDQRDELLPAAQDYLIDVAKRECRTDGRPNSYELIFWPTANDNYLLLSNPHDRLQASVLDIQVAQALMKVRDSAQAESEQHTENPTEFESETGGEIRSTTQPTRLAGIYLDKPLLADFFACERLRDLQTGRALESWQTWCDAFNRLEQYLQWTHSNLLVLKICADGGSVLPSRSLGPTPRYDTGVFWSDGRAPEIKDAVDLLMRYGDRSGLKIVLALDLDSPLPALSRFEEQDLSLFQQRLKDQSVESSPQSLNRYNPLNKQFQAAIKEVVQEIVTRYQDHESFAGVQLQFDCDSQLVFRGDKWGYNASLLEAFEKSTHGKMPSDDQLPWAMAGTLRLAFLQWRAQS